jgi:release factor glutamine methyltransferase
MRNGPVTVFDKEGNLIRGQIDMPPQYLRGWVEFYKLKFKVTPDVLIPRPETELLVDEVLNWVSANPKIKYPLKDHRDQVKDHYSIIDVGTGSGCIATSIAKNLKRRCHIMAIDISKAALDIAQENLKKHRVSEVFLLECDLLSTLSPLTKSGSNRPDIIVTNLPYIPNHRIDYLDPSVRDFEPRIALQGGPDGFDLYRRLFSEMKEKNLIPKLFIGEIDETQEEIALQEAKKYFPEAKSEVKKDLAKKPRIILIRFTF